ncbi:MAG: FtsX-like permease family protein [Acidiferrobacterales bacterium]
MRIVIQLAWRNLWRNRRRTWLTAGAIAFSTILLVVWVPMQFGAYEIMVDASLRVFPGHAQVQRPGYQDKPKIRNAIDNAEALAQSLRRSNQYTGVAVRGQSFALLSSGTRSYGAQVIGVEPEHEGNISSIPGLIKQGRYLSRIDGQEIVLGSALARNLNVKLGGEVTVLGGGKDGSVAAAILPVVGFFESGSNDLDRLIAEIPLHTFQSIFNMGKSAHAIAVVGKSVEKQPQLIAALNNALSSYNDVVVLGWEELVPGLKEGIEVDKATGAIFRGILVAVVVFSILNTFLMSIVERTREFGLMLALGSRHFQIAQLVMLESALLTMLGLIVGTVIGAALVYWLSVVGFTYPALEELAQKYNLVGMSRIYPQLNAYNFLLGPITILVATNLAAWIPILRIRKLEPVEAMRTV